MFQFPRLPLLALYIQARVTEHYLSWVAPFGNLRIKAYVQLTAAYRSLSRPSSTSYAKASTVCP